MSTYPEALTALIDHQYTKHVEINKGFLAKATDPDPETIRIFTPDTRDQYAIENEQVIIAGRLFGEMGVGNDFYNSPEVDFGTFDNCREYGLTVTIAGWTFAAYQHRNSDYICITACPVADVAEYGPYAANGDKNDCVLFDTEWRQYQDAAKALAAGMNYVKTELDYATTEGLRAAMKASRKENR